MKLKRRKKLPKQEIWIYNNGEYEREQVCAEKWMRIIYETPAGASLLFLVKRKMLSRLYGAYCKTPLSARKIPRFIQQYQIDMTGCSGSYKNFAEFFSRERTNVNFPKDPAVLGSPCEGVASVLTDIDPQKLIAAKSSYFSLSELFADEELAESYRGGTMVRIRLAPANYHRMHFFDDGKIAGSKLLNGDLFSVSPLAIDKVMRLYCRNKRALILFDSQHFGEVALVEVGATFVGSIEHCFEDGEEVQRGQLGSIFLPGGSLLLMFFKKGEFVPSETLRQQSAEGYETKVMLGDRLNQ